MKYKYNLKRKFFNFGSRYLVNDLKQIGFLSFVFYILYFMFFFFVLAKAGVDVTIGIGIFLLFFLLYRNGRKFIDNYVWSLSKNLYLNYFTLNKLLLTFRVIVYRYNRVYLRFFRYNFFVLKIVSNSMSLIYNKLSLALLNKYLINLMYNKLALKLHYIISKTNNLPIEYVLKSNAVFELNKFIAFDTLFFLL